MDNQFKKIASFTVDHELLLPGLYVSRVDQVGQETITTFDLRITRPNLEPVLSTGAIHALEHLGATYLRNHQDYQDQIIYFGPMGCRTGFYLIMAGTFSPSEIVPILKDTFEYISQFDGDIPGASPKECGNYRDMDLPEAKRFALKYLEEFLNKPQAKQMQYSIL